MVEFLNYELTKNITTAIDLCIYLSYPLNFAIYCGMSRCTIGSLLTSYDSSDTALLQTVPGHLQIDHRGPAPENVLPRHKN